MTRLILRRCLYAVFQLVGASIVIFGLMRLLPHDPAASILGPDASADQRAALRSQLGLDKPIPVQYWVWLKHVVHGDLGRSWYTSQAVTTDIGTRLPATLELVGLALIVTIVVLVPIGVWSARKPTSRLARGSDKGVFMYGMLAGAIPDFLVGILAIFFFYSLAHWAPAPLGRLDLIVSAPPKVTGLYTVDSLIAGNWEAFRSALTHLFLPVITLTFVYGAPILKMTRQTVKTMLDSEFVDQARATGLQGRTILAIALRNAFPPVLITMGLTFGYVVGGAVLVETVFSWGGLGQYAVQAIANADLAAVQGFVLVATAISIVVYLVVDILHVTLDPRIQVG